MNGVLVVGGAGYIGSQTAYELIQQGERVVVLDDLSTGFRRQVPREAAFVEGCAGDGLLLDRLFAEYGIGAIVHLAAKIVVSESVQHPLDYYLANTVRSRELLAAAVRAGIKDFVFSSTAAVYGDPAMALIGEDAPLAPISPYGRSKLMVEWMLRDVAAAHGLRYVALRYFNVAGADPMGRTGESAPHATHLVKIAVQAALGIRSGLEVFGSDYPTPDGTCVRDYVHVADLASAHVSALRHLRQGGENLTLNCGYSRGYSVREVIDVVKRVSGVDFEVTFSPRRQGDPAQLVAKADLIREKLGWIVRHGDLDAIVGHALAWERRLRILASL